MTIPGCSWWQPRTMSRCSRPAPTIDRKEVTARIAQIVQDNTRDGGAVTAE